MFYDVGSVSCEKNGLQYGCMIVEVEVFLGWMRKRVQRLEILAEFASRLLPSRVILR